MMKRAHFILGFVIFLSTLSISLSPQSNIHPSKGLIDESTILLLDVHMTPDNEKNSKDSKLFALSILAFIAAAIRTSNQFSRKHTAIRQWYPHYVTVFYQSSYFGQHRFDLRTV
ncbi:hypothetical protein [Virgibacillus senegalensis]|uniref:hypothetical protein n=1 Tax=Virgibacillus senegalensis TaxID=1499679 RepID=UPI00069FB5B0|nr:hypothetical protein [Virgibacillus senegalensis]